MDRSKDELSARIRVLMGSMFNKVRSMPPADTSDLELTISQRKTLMFLGQGMKHMNEVATYLGISTSSATSMIDRLVNKQLVERVNDPADRRIVSCRLTDSGVDEVNRYWANASKQFENISKILTLDELEVVVRAMEILLSAIERQTDFELASGDNPMPNFHHKTEN